MSLNNFRTKNFFKTINIKDLNIRNNSFHEILDNHYDKMINLYDKNENFKEIMPFIHNNKKMQNFHKKLVNKEIKFQFPFIKDLENKKKKTEIKNDNIKLKMNQLNELYKQSDFDWIKLKKKRLERFKNLKELELKNNNRYSNNFLMRSSSNFNENMIPITPNINQNFSLNDSNYSLNNTNNNFSSSNIFSKGTNRSMNSKDKSTYYKSDTNFGKISLYTLNLNSPIINKTKIKYIMDKCDEEIDSGRKFKKNINKIDETFSTKIKKNYKSIRLMGELSEKNLNNKAIKKYKNIEKNNIIEIKRRMNEKISNYMAFKNGKGFNEFINNTKSSNAYYIYLHDIKKENKLLEKLRKKDRKKIFEVKILCENDYRRSEILKEKIDIFNKKYRNEKRIKDIITKRRHYLTNRKNIENDEELKKGKLISKIMSLKEKCNKEIFVGNFINEKKDKILKVYK